MKKTTALLNMLFLIQFILCIVSPNCIYAMGPPPGQPPFAQGPPTFAKKPPLSIVNIVTPPLNKCFGDCNATANVIVIGGTKPYTYLWDDPNAQTTKKATGLCAGTYMVTVTDANGDIVTGIAVITEGDEIILVNSVTNITCSGSCDGSIDLTVTGGTSPYIYSWSNGATTQDITSLCAGTYDITVTDDKGCIAIATITLTDPPVLTASITGTETCDNIICNGSADLIVTGGTPAYTYAWSNGATTEDIFSLCTGNYDVIVTDNNGCTTTASVTISLSLLSGSILPERQIIFPVVCTCFVAVPSPPSPFPTPKPIFLCYYYEVVFSNPDINANSWDWTITQLSTGDKFITSTVVPDVSLCVPDPGDYQVGLTVSDGNCTITTSEIFNIFDCCPIPDCSGQPQFCTPSPFSPCKWSGTNDKEDEPIKASFDGTINESLKDKIFKSPFFIQNYPNPFLDETRFVYSLGLDDKVTIEIYNLSGKHITTLINNVPHKAGKYEKVWKTEKIPAGMYYYKFNISDKVINNKMVIIK